MIINFTNPLYLLSLLVIIPLIVFIHFFSLAYTRKKALKFANFEAIERVTGTQIMSKNYVILYIQLAIVLFFVLALSGPSLNYVGKVTDRNIILTIDSSSSMASNDVSPTRLDAAKQLAVEFVDSIKGTSGIGVVSFAGNSFIEQEITKDKEKIKKAISQINLKPVGGTDMLDAIITSTNLIKTSNKRGALVLLTDGQFNVGNLKDVLNYTSDENIPIYSISIGTEKGGYFEEGVLSKLEEDSLKNLSNYTGGKYYNAETNEQLRDAYAEIANMKKEQTSVDISVSLFVISFALILLQWLLINTKYRTLP